MRFLTARHVTFGLQLAAVCGAALICDPVQAQAPATAGCATQVAGEGAQVRAVPPGCGTAILAVDAGMRRQGMLDVRVGRGSVYVRNLKLIYTGSGNAIAGQIVDVQVHRLMEEGETVAPVAVSRNGLGLASVVVNVSPPGYGSEHPVLVLAGQQDAVAAEAAAAAAAEASEPKEWALIGSSFAHLERLRDGIAIGRQKGRFDRLVLSTRGNDLPVQSVQVIPYSNPPFTTDLRTTLVPGTFGKVIAIDPPDFVREVIVSYTTSAPQTRPPAIEVRGRYAENWQGRTGENRQVAGGWVLLGTVEVVASPHRAGPRGPYSVQGQEGAVFKRVRFVARRAAVAIAGATVDTAGGQQEAVPVSTMLLPDVETQAFAFASGPVAIAKLAIRPVLHPQSRVDATVEVWAQY